MYQVIGISSGGGVSLFPFKKHLIGNIESRAIFHTPHNNQWEANFGKIPLYRDFKFFQKGYIPADVVISSPDCGSGSVLRFSRAKKMGDHKKNHSLALFFEGIQLYQPYFFLFENLDGLFKSFPRDEFTQILNNYRLIIHSAPVSMWGNSQIHRKRLVIVGIREDISPKVDRYFKLPDYRDQNQTCKELYGDLDNVRSFSDAVDKAHIREDLFQEITIYAGKKMLVSEIMKHWQSELKGKRRWEVTDRKFTTAPGVYRNRGNDYPATARKANRQFDHHGLMLTPRQLARIQGVPDDFKILVHDQKLGYWINKGRALVTKTPPMEISQWFKRKLDKTKNLNLW